MKKYFYLALVFEACLLGSCISTRHTYGLKDVSIDKNTNQRTVGVVLKHPEQEIIYDKNDNILIFRTETILEPHGEVYGAKSYFELNGKQIGKEYIHKEKYLYNISDIKYTSFSDMFDIRIEESREGDILFTIYGNFEYFNSEVIIPYILCFNGEVFSPDLYDNIFMVSGMQKRFEYVRFTFTVAFDVEIKKTDKNDVLFIIKGRDDGFKYDPPYILCYKNKIYLPDLETYAFTGDNRLLYVKKMDYNIYQLYIEDDLIVSSSQMTLLENGLVYYKEDDTIYKWNDNNISIIKKDSNEVSSSYFFINDDGSLFIYYCLLKNGGSAVYVNDSLMFRPRHGISEFEFSPNGKNFYFVEAGYNQFIIRYFINGQIIPERLSGTYRGLGVIGFSNDSNYCAFIVRLADENNAIIINSRVIGPYWAITNGRFSEDSRYFTFRYADDDAILKTETIRLE
jgi:hypothetical protein